MSKDQHLGPNDKYSSWTKLTFPHEEETVKQISIGRHYSMIVTTSGHLYISG